MPKLTFTDALKKVTGRSRDSTDETGRKKKGSSSERPAKPPNIAPNITTTRPPPPGGGEASRPRMAALFPDNPSTTSQIGATEGASQPLTPEIQTLASRLLAARGSNPFAAVRGSYPVTLGVAVAGATLLNRTQEGPAKPSLQSPARLTYDQPVVQLSGNYNDDISAVRELVSSAKRTAQFSLEAKNGFDASTNPTPSLLNALPASVLDALNGVVSVGRSVGSYLVSALPEEVRETSANVAASSVTKGKAVLSAAGVGLPGKTDLPSTVAAMHSNATAPSEDIAHEALIDRQRALIDQQITSYQARQCAAALDMSFRTLFGLVPAEFQDALNDHLRRVAELEQIIENATLDLDEMPDAFHQNLPDQIRDYVRGGALRSRTPSNRSGESSGRSFETAPSSSVHSFDSAASTRSALERLTIRNPVDAGTRLTDRNSAEEELRNLEQRRIELVTSLPLDLRRPVKDVFQCLNEIKQEFRAKWNTSRGQIDGANNEIAQALVNSCVALADAQPGFNSIESAQGVAERGAFRKLLRVIARELLAQYSGEDVFPPNSALRDIIYASAQSCHRDPGQATHALTALRELAASDFDASALDEPKYVLAAKLVGLPRGDQVLKALLRKSEQPLADENKRQEAFVVALKSSAFAKDYQAQMPLEQVDESRAIEMAERGISRRSPDSTIAFLASALELASKVLRGEDVESMPSEATIAYTAVKNDLMSKAPGSRFELIDQALRSLTEGMLDSAVLRTGGAPAVKRAKDAALARLPIAAATPLNPSTLQAMVNVAKSMGLAIAPEKAQEKFREKSTAWLNSVARTEGSTAEKIGRIENTSHRCLALLMDYCNAIVNFNDSQSALSRPFETEGARAAQLALLITMLRSQAQTPLEIIGNKIAEQPRDYPVMQALSDLLNRILKSEAKPSVQLSEFAKSYRKMKAAIYFHSSPEIRNAQQLADYFAILAENLDLRDRVKIVSGKAFGASTSPLSGFARVGKIAIAGQLDNRYTHESSRVLELGMGTQAFQLAITTQSTDAGAYFGFSASVAGSVDSATPSYQPRSQFKSKLSREKQMQEGALIRVPRDKVNQERQRIDYVDLAQDITLWQNVQFRDGERAQGPLEALLYGYPDASVVLLGDYDRKQSKAEVGVGIYPISFSGPITFRAGLDFTAANFTSVTRAAEESGYFRYQDTKVGAGSSQKVAGVASAAIPAKTFTDEQSGKVKGGIRVGAGSLLASADVRTKENAITTRLTTLNDETKPLQSRFIFETVDFSEFERRVKDEWALWINHGINYTKMKPEDINSLKESGCTDADILRIRQATHENELQEFLKLCNDNKTEFSVFAIVKALTDVVALQDDRLRSEMLIARAERQDEAAERLQFQKDELLSDPSSWQERRLVMNFRAVERSQPGIDLGLVAINSSTVEGYHNEYAYPQG
jgi:hypothetical protein